MRKAKITSFPPLSKMDKKHKSDQQSLEPRIDNLTKAIWPYFSRIHVNGETKVKCCKCMKILAPETGAMNVHTTSCNLSTNEKKNLEDSEDDFGEDEDDINSTRRKRKLHKPSSSSDLNSESSHNSLSNTQKRCKWSDAAVHMLVSIWSHDQVQNNLKSITRNQHIWESIAKYMQRRGYDVTGVQCKTRIKNMLVIYNEAVKKKDPSLLDPYFNVFKKVDSLKLMKVEKNQKNSNKLKIFDSDSEENLGDGCLQSESGDTSQNIDDCSIEYLDTNEPNIETNQLRQLEQTITTAFNNLSNTITKAINEQTKNIEKLVNGESERMLTLLAIERENRQQLEKVLNLILSKSDVNHHVNKSVNDISVFQSNDAT